RSIKAGASVLKFEKGEYSLPAEDRTGAQERRLGQGPEREAFRLGEDPLSQGVDHHLRLLLRRADPDVEGPGLDLLLPDHNDVGNPFLLRRPDFLRERVVRIVEVGADVWQAVEQASGELELVDAHGDDPNLGRREPDGQHGRLTGFRGRGGFLQKRVEDPLDGPARGEMQDERMASLPRLVRERDAETFRVLRV